MPMFISILIGFGFVHSSEETITIGDGISINMLGVGIIKLRLTSKKTLTLLGVQHVVEIQRNLTSGIFDIIRL